MAEMITLRNYLQDLESMVENESPTEVVSHCRYILQHFPQNVATYRLLGKALLQKGHHEGLPEHFVQAADIFQRVLSVLPDDAVSHLALSEIREQEGALDQAIWHMERAQDQLPGNALIQEALRKLYTRHIGREAAIADKLQLSRGALARQYANSQLHDQAVLELRYALQATPGRVDLQLLLAKLLWDSQHFLEAGEIAVDILKQLPYSLEANSLMARLWLAYGRPTDAQPYIDQVEALDPYAAMQILRPDGEGPDSNRLPRLDYSTRAAASLSAETPEWVHDLDDLEDFTPQSLAPSGADLSAINQRGPERIDTAAIFGDVGESEQPPDWTRGFVDDESNDTPDWFSEVNAEHAREKPPTAPLEAAWLAEDADLDTEAADPAPSDEVSEMPGWFAALADTDGASPDSTSVDWLAQTDDEAATLALDTADELPGELEGLTDELEQAQPLEMPADAIDESQADEPDWFSGLGAALQADAQPEEQLAAGDAETDALGWLYGGTSDDGTSEATADVGDVPSEEQALDWMPFDEGREDALLPDTWLQSGTDTDRASAPDTGELPLKEDASELDRLFEALTAAEAAGTELGSSDYDGAAPESAADMPRDTAVPDPDDWMALFDEPVATQPAVQPEPESILAEPAPSDAPEWGAMFPEEWPEDDQAVASLEAPIEPAEPAQASAQHIDAEPVEADEGARTAEDWFREHAEDEDDAEIASGLQVEASAADTVDALDWDAQAAAPGVASGPPEIFGATEDQALLAALSQTVDADDDWLSQFGGELEAASLPDLSAEDTLSEDDIFAIFGEPAEAAPSEPDSGDAGSENAIGQPWQASDNLDQGWLAPEADQPGAETFGAALSSEESGGIDWPEWDPDAASEDDPVAAQPALETHAEEPAPSGMDDASAQDDFAVFAAEDEVDAAESVVDRPTLSGLARAVEQAQQEKVPDWMAGLEISAPDSGDEDFSELFDESYDPFEGGDPANVPTYESAGHTGILQPNEEPDWMRAFSGELTSDEDGEPADAISLDFAAADLLDDGPDDAVAAFDAAASARDERPAEPVPTPPFDAVEWDMPGDDLILGFETERRAEAENELPDWLSAITQTASDAPDDLGPDEQDLLLTDADAQVVPEWLREVDEPASDASWAADSGVDDAEVFASADDFADTLANTESVPSPATEAVDDFDRTFSFADRLPTWLRRAKNRPNEG